MTRKRKAVRVERYEGWTYEPRPFAWVGDGPLVSCLKMGHIWNEPDTDPENGQHYVTIIVRIRKDKNGQGGKKK